MIGLLVYFYTVKTSDIKRIDILINEFNEVIVLNSY